MATGTALAVTVDDGMDNECSEQSEGLILYDANLPSTEGWDVWRNTEKVSSLKLRWFLTGFKCLKYTNPVSVIFHGEMLGEQQVVSFANAP